MMRTIEVFLVIIIITGAFIIASFYAVLPVPRRVSPLNLRRLALTTLQVLDADYSLSDVVFKDPDDPAWSQLQVALSALLPPNIVYNLTVYIVRGESGEQLYIPWKSISNAESLGIQSEASSYLVTSSNVTFRFIPEKIGERQGASGTLYILNCSDARGWWITGYTAHTLAQDLYNILSPYFRKTIVINDTDQFAKILKGESLSNEAVRNAVLINTFGEAIPIPSGYCKSPYSDDTYARYCHFLGEKVREYNWTWVSIVGYPFYYVTNTKIFTRPGDQNTYGIYGMKLVGRLNDQNRGQSGLRAFLQGLTNKTYQYNSSRLAYDVGEVYLSKKVKENCNYYGIYPSCNQTSTRAISKSILTDYPSLVVGLLIFNEKSGCYPGALFNHISGGKPWRPI
ncbi:MAG: hypothetical protein QXZ68_02815 [Candidatus Bathyarchaeia archaeon]